MFQIIFKLSMSMSSSIWQHFEQGRDDDSCKTGTCRICESKIRCSGSSTSGLWLHLKNRHDKEYDKLKEKDKKKSDKQQASFKVAISQQPTLQSLVSNMAPYKSNHPKQIKFDRNMLNLIIHDGVPFKIASSKFFKKTILDLDPRVKVKTRQTYSKYITQLEAPVKRKLKDLLKKNAKGLIAVTSDLWDDKKQNAFCSVTVHYVNDDFELVRVTPAIKFFGSGRHTSENIAEVLGKEVKALIDDVIDPVVVLVTDSAAPMVKARKLLVEKQIVDQQMGCANHKIQNCIKKAFKETENVKKVMVKAKKLAKHIRKSTLANNRLKSACQKSGHKYLRMKSSVDIRWNSEFDCCERLLYHQDCIKEMERRRELESVSASLLTRSQWRLLEDLLEILKPLKIATKVLESETQPTINRVPEIIFDETSRLKDIIKDDGDENIKEFARHLLADIKERFPEFGLLDISCSYSNFLDPRLKGVHLEQTGNLGGTIKAIERHIAKFGEDGNDEVNDVSDEKDDNDNMTLTPTAKLLQKKVSNSNTQESSSRTVKSAQSEIEEYLKLQACPSDLPVLSWWKRHTESLPRLSAFACMFLAVPASSSASERLFSISGCFDSLRRGNMRLESLETLTLMKTNFNFLEENNINIQELTGGENSSEENENDDLSGEDSDEESDGPDDDESDTDSEADESDRSTV